METISLKETEASGYIAFFDLDRTIIGAVSGTVLAREAFKRGLMKRLDMIQAIWLSAIYKLGILDPLSIVNKMTGWVSGLPEVKLNELCSDVFDEILLPSLHREALPEIKMHKERNAKVVLLSSTLSPICRMISGYLGLDDTICSHLETINGILTGHPSGKLCFGQEKLTRLKDYCELNNSNHLSAWYYADAYADLPALSIVGTPVCVNPEKKLLKAAVKKGWKVYYWTV